MILRIFVLLTAVTLLTSSCAPPEVRACNRECDCEGCSESEFDDCVDDFDDKYAEADRRNCLPEYRNLMSCENATGICDGDDYDTDCGPERSDFDDCVD